jgi:hypothetical protein
MKGFTNSLPNLYIDVTDCVLMLNILRGLHRNFEHLYAMFMNVTPFLLF